MFSKDKLDAVRVSLKAEFPEYEMADQYDSDRYAQTFRLTKANDQRIFLVTVAREFLDDHEAAEISNILQRTPISGSFRSKHVSRVIISNSGIRGEVQ